ncbi:mRNA splicing protein [Friedmanniomyces endolithicus]|uniref:Pre-mRNA-splicing factor SLU7 n=1 Tax=Friedmanniomyces endolithicus TaxID=329885 RepID=A0AAN6FHG4_9PEZI|nr:mRNA splicing protein [Friedmanniomyces endolithicus]KAK0294141.1 mRNA splicing protein [Friedmanniomyces endolithicus]KAK0315093.1 mRNA splicing protein [Friedmanniomyces endolithicus]KAK0908714.1 mRNA splicing protein [Friedmanniomyces endolithicus]KAK0989142.1 mRNA splicing protein [Friedmanniomyces endolithicus]
MSNKKPADNKSNDRNEYIPSFISKKPFYVSDALASDSDYLEHQRLQNDSREKNDSLANAKWYTRGSTTTTAPKATKYRKGACENCGSMSHKRKDCLQRKRKHGAKWTGRDIAGDEKVEEVRLGWDAKRDRWNGFEAGEYKEVVDDFEVVEEMRKRKARAAAGGEEGGDGEDVDGEEGAKYEEETDMGRKQSTSTRQLRLREDTAKYLLNLDLDSAKYDPKTRSMLDTATSTNELIAEDGFQKASGDAAEFERATRYAWETQERGDGDRIHLQANPTEAQLTRKRKAEDDISKQEKRKKELADKYGAQDAVVKKLGGLVAESSERYVEYDERGRIKGAEKERKEKSMYAEDVLVNNHTSVWGSWWEKFQWGYACCHSTVKNSFCTGEEGRKAAQEAELFSKGLLLLPAAGESGGDVEEASRQVEVEERPVEEKTSHVSNASDRPEKQKMDESRRRMEELKAGITEEDMERYRKEKTNKSDPMAAMLGRDELVG